MDARQTLYDGYSYRRKALSLLCVIAEELDNCTWVLGVEAAIHVLEKLGGVTAFPKLLCDHDFGCKKPKTYPCQL